jgi:ribosome maturation factor RimP
MRTTDETTTSLLRIAEPVCLAAGFELVDVRFVREQVGWIVRVFIEAKPGAADGVGVGDCERVSRELSAVLDVEDPVPQAYSLEVSSPGIDRPLRTVDHFRRFAGSVAKIVLAEGIDGRRNYKGTLLDASNEVIAIEIDGTRHEVPFDDIQSAKLVPDWGKLMQARRN